MTGRASFLERFLTPSKNLNVRRTKHTAYQASLQSPVAGGTNGSPSPSVQESNISISPYAGQQLQLHVLDDEDEEEMDQDEELNYEQWRTHCNIVLTQYIYQRYVLEKQDDDGDDGDVEGGEEDHELMEISPQDDTQPASQAYEPESQDDWIAQKNIRSSNDGGGTTPKPKMRLRIPLVQNTQHVSNSVSQLDLYTKTLNLSLCRVEMLFSKRHTRRMEGSISAPAIISRRSSDSSSLLPLVRFGSHNDDGPLFSAYKNVVSMEVTQLLDPTSTRLRETASSAFTNSKLHRRISIFFYKKYAKAVDAFVSDRENKDCQFYIRIEHVPAACIFPYQRDNKLASWYDQDLSPYVLCIGDRSNISTDQSTGNGRLSFESKDLVIHILAQPIVAPGKENAGTNNAAKGRECTIDMESAAGSAYRSSTKTGILHAALEEWKNTHHVDSVRRIEEVNARRQHYEVATSQAMTSPGGNEARRRAAADRDTLEIIFGDASDQQQAEPPAKRARTQQDEARAEQEQPAQPRISPTLGDLGYDKLKDIVEIYAKHKNTPPEAQTSKFPSATVVGVVLAFNQPSLTKSNQWLISVALVDQSLPVVEDDDDTLHIMNVNIFRKNRIDLPKIHNAGDLLRLHDAGIQDYNGYMQLLGRSTCKMHVIRKEPTHFHFDGEDIHFSLDETDMFTSLWEWGQRRLATKSTLKRSLRFKLSEGAYIEEAGDSTVMICGMYESPFPTNRQFPQGYIRVWDGTGAPMSDPLPDESQAALATVADGDPPREALVALHLTVHELNTSPCRPEPSKDLGEILSLCGCVVNIAVWELPHWEFVKLNFKIGDFMRLRNVGKGSLDNGLICLMALAKSWLIPIPRQTLEVRKLLEDHQLRLERNDALNPNSGLLPIHLSDPPGHDRTAGSDQNNQAATTSGTEDENRDDISIQDPTTEVERAPYTLQDCAVREGKSQCTFSVVKLLPECSGNLSKLCKTRKGKTKYQFAATIRDASRILSVLLVGNVGEKLLGVSATDAGTISRRDGQKLISDLCKAGVSWEGTIDCRVLDNENYFFIKSLLRKDMISD